MGVFDILFARQKPAFPGDSRGRSSSEMREALAEAERELQDASSTAARAVALMNRGRARTALGELEAAISDFDEVVSIAPLFPAAYLDRGTARSLKGDAAPALADLDKAIALYPAGEERAIAYGNRGIACEAADKIACAIQALRKAEAGGWAPARAELDRIRARGGAVEDVPEEAPDPIAAAARCADARRVLARTPLEALVLFHQATELAPDLQEAAHGLGIVNAALGRAEEAVAAFDRSLAIQPQHPGMRAEALFNRGQLRAACGDLPGAITDLEACLALCRDDQIAFPDFGDPAKEAIFVGGVQHRLDRLRAALRAAGGT